MVRAFCEQRPRLDDDLLFEFRGQGRMSHRPVDFLVAGRRFSGAWLERPEDQEVDEHSYAESQYEERQLLDFQVVFARG